jgi:ribosomal protein L16 Arg81 hydroxylase
MQIIEPVDPTAFKTQFPDRTFPIRHNLVGNPLFSLERLIQLLQTMPRDRIEFSSGKAAISQDPATTPTIDLTPAEIVTRIETCDAWMVLKQVESDPAYRALLEDALLTTARAQGHNSLADAGYSDIRGFIFVSSPGSTTPFHVDNEDNFFVQLHGEKFFHVYDNTDRGIASEEMLEDVVVKHRNLKFDPAFDVKATHYTLKPGDGIFVPYQWPHYVQTSDTYSISMAITWKSEEVMARNDIFVVNSMLRSLGLPQMPPGTQPMFDGLKLAALRSVAAIIEPLRRSEAVRRTLRRLALGKNANYYYGKDDDEKSRAA